MVPTWVRSLGPEDVRLPSLRGLPKALKTTKLPLVLPIFTCKFPNLLIKITRRRFCRVFPRLFRKLPHLGAPLVKPHLVQITLGPRRLVRLASAGSREMLLSWVGIGILVILVSAVS